MWEETDFSKKLQGHVASLFNAETGVCIQPNPEY